MENNPFIVELPMQNYENSDFPYGYVRLPEGTPIAGWLTMKNPWING